MVKFFSDLTSMPRGTALLKLVLLPKEVALVGAEDLVAAFYLLELPAVWRPCFTFRRPVDAGILGGRKGKQAYVCSWALPMGFSGATSVLQHRHIGTGGWRSADCPGRSRCSGRGLLARKRSVQDGPCP